MKFMLPETLSPERTKRILLTAVVAATIFVRCDSFNIADVDSATDSASLIESVRTYYEAAIQPNGLDGQIGGKISGDSIRAAVLAEMVRQYPPDWTQAVTWRDGNEYHLATILGAGKPSINPAQDSIAVVRTLVADLNEDGKVTDALLVEFASSDPLDPASFAHYVKQWFTQDYGDNKVLAAEYSLGYEGSQAYLYNPSDSVLTPASLSLEKRRTAGKAAREDGVFCWYSLVEFGEICGEHPTTGVEECNARYRWELTCVQMDSGGGEDGGGGGGGGGDDGNGDSVGTGGGGDDGKDDDGEDTSDSLYLSCDSSVERGRTAGCTVNAPDDGKGLNPDQLTYDWSSSSGATFTGTGTGGNEWRGTATESVTVSVAVVSQGFSDSQEITVNARSGWGVGQASVTSVTYANLGSILGRYTVPSIATPTFGDPVAGGGPWSGRFASGSAPSFSGDIQINDNYGGGSNTYRNARRDGCLSARNQAQEYETYSSINSMCGTTADMNAYEQQIRTHEYGHHNNLNSCFGEAQGVKAMASMEAIVGESAAAVGTALGNEWSSFYSNYLGPAMAWSPAAPGGVEFYHARNKGLVSEHWSLGVPATAGHTNANCN